LGPKFRLCGVECARAVVKATRTGEGLWVTSYRLLHQQDAVRDSEVRRLLKKAKK